MSCPDEPRLIRLVSGELDAREAQDLERHLEECPRCAGALEELRTTWSILGEWTEDAPAADLWPTVRATLELDARGRGGWLPQSRPAMLRAAASLAVAVGLGWATGAWIDPGQKGPPNESAETSIDDIMEPLGLDEFVKSSATGLPLVFEEDTQNGQEETT
jgi:anti-sigma factor RsiW